MDVAASVEFYRRMGFRQIVDSEHYARFEATDGEATFSVHKVERTESCPGFTVYFETVRLDHLVGELQADGFDFESLPEDKPWLWREARLRDPAGNSICLFTAGENRKFPPWRLD